MGKVFGKYIKTKRVQHGLSGENLGDLLGCSKQFISSVENGDKEFPINRINSLANVLEVEQKELYEQWYSSKMVSSHIPSNASPSMHQESIQRENNTIELIRGRIR